MENGGQKIFEVNNDTYLQCCYMISIYKLDLSWPLVKMDVNKSTLKLNHFSKYFLQLINLVSLKQLCDLSIS